MLMNVLMLMRNGECDSDGGKDGESGGMVNVTVMMGNMMSGCE